MQSMWALSSSGENGAEMPQVWASIGTNQHREISIRGAIRSLKARYGALQISPIYESEAEGFQGDPFLNLVVGFRTKATVPELLAAFRAIEAQWGRVRTAEKFTSRTLDLDLLTYGHFVGTEAGYSFPREEILKYAFVLRPLADVAPEEIHPPTGKTYLQLWQALAPAAPPLIPVSFSWEADSCC